MKIKLLDCPFCGGQADSALYTHDETSNGVAVRCTTCGASTKRLIYRHDDAKFPIVIKRMEDCQAETVKLWNKRSN